MSKTAPTTEGLNLETETILVLLANRENRSLLGELLRSGGYRVTNEFPVLDGSAPIGAGIDLCVVDGPSLEKHWDDVRAAQSAQRPVPLPVLLMTDRGDVGLATRDLWHVVDDVLHRPVDKLALRARIETLVRGRRLAIEVRELSKLYERERLVATRFQEAAMPRELPQVPGLTFSAVYHPATSEERVGGDWYDAVRLPDGRVVLSIGDVCGFGLDAAVAMAKVRQVVRGVAQIHPDPAMMLDAADRTLHAEDPERIVTAFVAVFDPVTSILTFASAGHPRPLLRHVDGSLTELVAFGLPLGLPMLMSPRATETVEIPSGALLLLYTDGVTEATHDPVEGEERLRSALRSDAIFRSTNVAEAIRAAVVPTKVHDDVAILAIGTSAQPVGDSFISRWSFDATDARIAIGVRRTFVATLRERGISEDDCITAELIFAELLGNVVRHAPGFVDVALDWAAQAPVLHVLDRGAGFRYYPKLPSDLLSECGRGLFIISSLAEEFLVTERPSGGSHARAMLPHRARSITSSHTALVSEKKALPAAS